MFLAFRANGAKDWRSNLTIALDHSGVQHRLQFHHIFPKAVLKKKPTPCGRQTISPTWLSLVARRIERSATKPPRPAYLPPMIAKAGEAPFQAQCIPLSGELLEQEGYARFLVDRRKRIAERLNAFLGTQ